MKDLLAGRGGHSDTGAPVDARSLAVLLCDSALHRVLMAGRSTVLDYGTATRTIPPPLYQALVIRDGGCRFPACDRPPAWCEGHHVVPVTARGPTSLANVVQLCRRHHRLLHGGGWWAKLGPDATLTVTDPHGRVRTTLPRRAA